MQITDVLAQMGGVQSLARELGVSETQAASGAAALAPAILGGFKKQAQSSGLEGLGGLLGRLGGGGLMDDVLAPQPTNVNRGNEVLGQIFGSKDVSRTVAKNAATSTGLSPDLLKKMLPMVAMLVAGYMAKQKGAGAAPTAQNAPTGAQAAPTGGGLGGVLGGLLGGGAGGAQRTGATGGLASMLDVNGDGNPLDDIMRMAGKIVR
jgi:hypothetical protein